MPKKTEIDFYGNTSGMNDHLWSDHKVSTQKDSKDDVNQQESPEEFQHLYENRVKKRFEKIQRALLIFGCWLFLSV